MKKFTKSVSAFAIGLTSIVATQVMAQSNSLGGQSAPISNPNGVLENYDAENLIPIIQEMGMQWKGSTLPTDEKVILARSPDGINFMLMPTACSQSVNTGCVGLNIMSVYRGNVPTTAVNSFNQRYSFISAGVADNNTSFLTRYEIADYGNFRGNLAANIGNYLNFASRFQQTLSSSKGTVSPDSFATDLAANSLNMNALFASDSPQSEAFKHEVSSQFTAHELGMEKTLSLVETFSKADELAPGKILNQLNVKK